MRWLVSLLLVLCTSAAFIGCAQLSKVPAGELALKLAVYEVAKKNPLWVAPIRAVISSALATTAEEKTTLFDLEQFVMSKLDTGTMEPSEVLLASTFVKELLVTADNYIRTQPQWYARDQVVAKRILEVIHEALILQME